MVRESIIFFKILIGGDSWNVVHLISLKEIFEVCDWNKMPKAEVKVLFYNGECYSYPFSLHSFVFPKSLIELSFIKLFFRVQNNVLFSLRASGFPNF